MKTKKPMFHADGSKVTQIDAIVDVLRSGTMTIFQIIKAIRQTYDLPKGAWPDHSIAASINHAGRTTQKGPDKGKVIGLDLPWERTGRNAKGELIFTLKETPIQSEESVKQTSVIVKTVRITIEILD